MADSGPNVSHKTYELIQTWIGRQQQAPAPLTDKLKSALVGLEYALKAESVSLAEPELDNQNYVGLLQEYRAAYPFNGSIEVEFAERSFDPTGRGPLRWRCEVTVGEAPGVVFPPADANQPSFARKKDAKKFAAKCAIEWLRAKSYMPQDGVRFPKGVLTAHHQMQRQKQQQQQQQQNTSTQQPKATNSRFTTTAATGGGGAVPSSPFDSSQPSLTNQVTELCRDLGYPPPAYKTELLRDGFWNGWADFGDHALLLPPEIADPMRVTDMISKSAAREMVAEKLLVPLRAEKERRHAENQAVLAGYDNGDAMKE
ncbi:hypothetical protein GGR51DRAFT_519194 [Nemania sp. FL0031]|nr:hypothetical protein GGR51DRAFT_519194 [Nemania sp. FL0031]